MSDFILGYESECSVAMLRHSTLGLPRGGEIPGAKINWSKCLQIYTKLAQVFSSLRMET